jgi:DNA-binding transcriptional MerR regulator
LSFEVSHKSAEAFRTISEVADALDLPQHVLRFWETRFPHVHPLKRAGNRRYYRPEDIDLLRGIAKLLYREGLTIKGVQKVLREQGVRYVADVGRGQTDFTAPLTRPRLTAVRDAEYAFGELALLHMEFSEPAESIEPLEAPERDDWPEFAPGEPEASVEAATAPALMTLDVEPEPRSNVHPFPLREDGRRNVTAEERARLEELLAELLAMKARLMAAKARAYGDPTARINVEAELRDAAPATGVICGAMG